MKKSVGFACPNISSMFRPTAAPPGLETEVRDVANAIYYGGRADGVPGMAAVAHVIQNRVDHPAYPSDACGVVVAGTEQFVPARQMTAAPPNNGVERQLFEQAKRMAMQLVCSPHRLLTPDPTGGALHYDRHRPAPATMRNVSRPAGDEPMGMNGAGNEMNPRRGDDAALRGSSPPPGAASPASPPSGARTGNSATRPLRPFSFLREKGAASIGSLRSRGAAAAAAVTSGSGSPTAAAASRGGTTQPRVAVPAEPPSMEPVEPVAAAPVHHPPAVSTPPGPLATQAATTPPPTPPPQSRPPAISMPATSPGPRTGSSAGSSGTSRPGHPRPWTGPRGFGGGRTVGPADDDGYHDMILPCGLFQEEVIDIMYRDLSPEDFEALCKLDERVPRRNTAQRNLVDGLPRTLAKDSGSTECGVCLGELEPNSSVVQLPCKHAFHPACVTRWLTQCKNTCPLCTCPINQVAQGPTAASGSAASAIGSTAPRLSQAV